MCCVPACPVVVNLLHLQGIISSIYVLIQRCPTAKFDQTLVHTERQCGKQIKYKQAALMKVLNRFDTTMFLLLKCFSC